MCILFSSIRLLCPFPINITKKEKEQKDIDSRFAMKESFILKAQMHL